MIDTCGQKERVSFYFDSQCLDFSLYMTYATFSCTNNSAFKEVQRG